MEIRNGKNIRVKRFNNYYKITPKNIHIRPINQYVLRFNNIVFCNKLLRHYLVTSKVRQTRRFDIYRKKKKKKSPWISRRLLQ